MNTGALILAAGKGTRMRSNTPKALQPLLGEPMLAHVAHALKPLFGDDLYAVIGHGADLVEAAFADSRLPALRFIRQTEQLGTGHALMVSLPSLAGLDRLVVINGDMPLISTGMMQRILEAAAESDLALASITIPEAGAYGRVVRDPRTGHCLAVVEAKDYDVAVHGPATGEINIGLYVLNLAAITPLLSRLSNGNNSGEYYITDLIGLAKEAGLRVTAVPCGSGTTVPCSSGTTVPCSSGTTVPCGSDTTVPCSSGTTVPCNLGTTVPCGSDTTLLGVNDPEELIRSESLLRTSIVLAHLRNGVTLHQPEQIVIGPFVTIEPGAVLSGPGFFLGHTHIARGVQVGPFCHITDTHVESDAVIQPYSHFLSAHVGPACTVGPFSRLRPGAVLDESAHVGNFVEMKKAHLGRGAKANHLTYIGDADIGPGSNIGAGTITCNYDGVNKHKTTIGERAFIGSNTSLVAPVTIGDRALVGAGSVITKDVPDDYLAVVRGPLKSVKKR